MTSQYDGSVLVSRATSFGNPYPQCQRRLHEGSAVNLYTGELTPHRCGSNGCPSCCRVKARQIMRAITAAEPEVMLTLTDVGNDWATIRSRIERLKRALAGRAVGMLMHWLWVVDCNRGDDSHQHHVHALAHGSVPPAGVSVQEEVLSDHAQRVGFGHRVHVREADELAGWYVMKEFREPGLEHFLAMNGGRPEHSSRGFWRVAGEPVGSRDAAIRFTSQVNRRTQFR